LNSCLHFRRQSEKYIVKRSIINLGRGAHLGRSRSAHSGTDAGFHFGLGLPSCGLKFRGKFHLVFNKIVKPIADLPQFCRGQLTQFALNLLHFVHAPTMLPFPETIKLPKSYITKNGGVLISI
jgi:hypothetical protein